MPAGQQELSPQGMYKEMEDRPLGFLQPVLVAADPPATFLIRQVEAVIYAQREHWRLRGSEVDYRGKCGCLHPIGEGYLSLIADSGGLNPNRVLPDFLLLVEHFGGHGFEVRAHFYSKAGLLDPIAYDQESWPSAKNLRDVIGISIEIQPPRGFTGRLPLCS